ncbi:MAG: elongation factor G [Alphaproteobacteria bacterium]|nr:elongation factor G [Alphaproteobacteria bacterium]
MADTVGSGPRCVALVGPYLSGKTTLLEAMLTATGAIRRKGSVKEGNMVGDASAVARKRQMSVELNIAHCEFMDEDWTILDCPGSIEFSQESRNALMAADIAVVVIEPDANKAKAVAPILKFLTDRSVPHVLFINKMDNPLSSLEETIAALQEVSTSPLVLRHVPIRDGDKTTGYVDLISQRAYQYKEGELSTVVEVPAELADAQTMARQELLELLADFNDDLLEQLLEDVVPEEVDIYRHLTENLASDNIVPVMIGAGEIQSGVFRLWKSLRHDAPSPATTAARRGFDSSSDPVAQVFKTTQARSGKLSHVRVWSGELRDSMQLGGERVGGLFRMFGNDQAKVDSAGLGDIVALGRLEEAKTGDVLTPSGRGEGGDPWNGPLSPVYAVAIEVIKRDDEVKLSSALAKLVEEDPSYLFDHNADTHELVLHGQGEIHLTVAAEQLAEKYNVGVSTRRPSVPYKETIRKQVQQHARHKKQSGGHGQFGDVHIEISPRPRGEGFQFTNRVVGGSVPRQYIPSVETGVRKYLDEGPLGFPIVDIEVCLYDGQHHAVDSSDMAFQTAAQAAMREGMPKCSPILLEPVYKVAIDAPSEHTSKVNQIVSGRRGQILGFDATEGWSGWDTVNANLPQSEMVDLIIELRSLTQGTGTFRYEFDHLQELSGREADAVVAQRQEAKAA